MAQAAVADIAIGPTRERIRQAKFGIDGPETTQTVDRRSHAIRDIWSDMRRRQQIDKTGEDVARKFADVMAKARKTRAITPSYGQRMAEGTPASQLSARAAEEDAARTVDWIVLHERDKAVLPPRARIAILMACSGKACIGETEQPYSLGEIGRMVSSYATEKQAAAVAVGVIATGLEILAIHYRMRAP